MEQPVRDRYRGDAKFKLVVDSMRAMLSRGDFTQAELAQATVLAAEMHAADTMTRPLVILVRDGDGEG